MKALRKFLQAWRIMHSGRPVRMPDGNDYYYRNGWLYMKERHAWQKR